MEEYMQKLVCAHELGHALLHRKLGATPGGMMEFEIFDIKDAAEYEANVFAANLLINVNILLVKLNEMRNKGYALRVPYEPARKFLGSIGDEVGTI